VRLPSRDFEKGLRGFASDDNGGIIFFYRFS
jgi:hypothetical protein